MKKLIGRLIVSTIVIGLVVFGAGTFSIKKKLQPLGTLKAQIIYLLGAEKQTLMIPRIAGKMPTNNIENNHFNEFKAVYVLTGADKMPVFTRPTENAQIINELHLGERVRVTYKKPGIVIKGKEPGAWVFVISSDGKRPIGWMVDIDLAYKEKFKPVKNWKIPRFYFCKDRYCGDFEIKPDGKYAKHWWAEGGGIELEGHEKGQLKIFRNLILAEKKAYNGIADIFVLAENEMGHEWAYRNHPIRLPPEN
jgi:hypothetical protein